MKDARNAISSLKTFYKYSHGAGYPDCVEDAIEALEKQIPKKPDDISFKKICGWVEGKCPVCGFAVFKPYGCQRCLNAIDWSEEE